MDDNSDTEEQAPRGHIKLKEGLNLKALLDGKGDTFEINFDSTLENEENSFYNPQDIDLTALASACLEIDSDDEAEDDLNSTPFEKMAAKMINVTEDGKIKKRIKREGIGNTPPNDSLVSINYTSYLEYNDEPTDYAFIKKPYQFRLGNAVVFGLDIAVQSMKPNEKALFIIHYDYAFGKMGHPPRIPPESTFLFVIELLRFVDSGPALEINNLSNEEKRQFPVAYKTALSLIENAKEYFKHNLKLAIREYNRAVSLLEECSLSDMADQEKQQKLLFKLYGNLAVCHTKNESPRKACTMCNNIYAMSKNTSLQITAKIYFHNGRALLMLGEYKRARDKLLTAQRLEPNNNDISNELAKVSAKMQEEASREKKLAEALLNTTKKTESSDAKSDEADTFTLEIRNLCETLIKSEEQTQFKLPSGLTNEEREAAKAEAESAGLKFRESKNNENDGKLTYYISKI